MGDTSTISKDAIDGVRRVSKVFQAVIDLADSLDGIVSIDNAVRESQQRLDKSREEESSLLAVVAKLNGEISGLTGKKAEHVVKAEAAVKAASAKVSEMLDAAKKQADEIIAVARENAAAVDADGQKNLEILLAKQADEQKKLDALFAEVAAASAERTKIQKAIDAIKNKFS